MTLEELSLMRQQVDAAGVLADAMLEQQQQMQHGAGVTTTSSPAHTDTSSSTPGLADVPAQSTLGSSLERLDQLRHRASAMRALTRVLHNNTRSLQESTEELTARGRAWEAAHSQVLTRVTAALEEASALSERERDLSAQADFLRARIAALEQQPVAGGGLGGVQLESGGERQGLGATGENNDRQRLARVGEAVQRVEEVVSIVQDMHAAASSVGGVSQAVQSGSSSSSNSNRAGGVGRGHTSGSENRAGATVATDDDAADARALQGSVEGGTTTQGGGTSTSVCCSFPVDVASESDVSTPTSCHGGGLGPISALEGGKELAGVGGASGLAGAVAAAGGTELGKAGCEGLGVGDGGEEGVEVGNGAAQQELVGRENSGGASSSRDGRRGLGAWLRQLW
jgi:hypothetical protein